MRVVFFTPPAEQRIGGLDAAIDGLRGALERRGIEVGDALPADARDCVAHFHGLWQPGHPRLARACAARGIPCVVSPHGKEAVIGILGRGSFFGEGGLAGQPLYLATATTVEDARIIRIDKSSMIRLLHDDRTFSTLFLAHMLTRNVRIQEDLVDQLFNSSEKRLARALLLMAHFGKEGKPEEVIPKVSQETLAEMIGTTRSRVSFFMTKFKKMGLIHYDSGLHVHSSLFNIVLHD